MRDHPRPGHGENCPSREVVEAESTKVRSTEARSRAFEDGKTSLGFLAAFFISKETANHPIGSFESRHLARRRWAGRQERFVLTGRM